MRMQGRQTAAIGTRQQYGCRRPTLPTCSSSLAIGRQCVRWAIFRATRREVEQVGRGLLPRSLTDRAARPCSCRRSRVQPLLPRGSAGPRRTRLVRRHPKRRSAYRETPRQRQRLPSAFRRVLSRRAVRLDVLYLNWCCPECRMQQCHSQPIPSSSRSRWDPYPGSPRRTGAAPAARAAVQLANAPPPDAVESAPYRLPRGAGDGPPRWQ